METLEKPLMLFRQHGHGKSNKIHPVVSRYKTEEDYRKAIFYNLHTRPHNALFSITEILNQGSLTDIEATELLNNIKKGRYNIPESFTNMKSLHTA